MQDVGTGAQNGGYALLPDGPVEEKSGNDWESHDVQCEKVLTDIYQSMFKVKEQIGLAQNEIYVWHFWGHYLFLPSMIKSGSCSRLTKSPVAHWCAGLHLCGSGCHLFPAGCRWSLPADDMDTLATCIRRLARLLWTVHLDFSEVSRAVAGTSGVGQGLLAGTPRGGIGFRACPWQCLIGAISKANHSLVNMLCNELQPLSGIAASLSRGQTVYAWQGLFQAHHPASSCHTN